MYAKKVRPQSRESRERFGETETRKRVPRRDQSRGLESRLQPLVCTYFLYIYKSIVTIVN